jgi:hypothetical protein
MSQNINGIPVICAEEDDICHLCDKVAECRPYGPGGKRICFDCAMKDRAETRRQMNQKLFGEKPAN